jgi:hypothetical protein
VRLSLRRTLERPLSERVEFSQDFAAAEVDLKSDELEARLSPALWPACGLAGRCGLLRSVQDGLFIQDVEEMSEEREQKQSGELTLLAYAGVVIVAYLVGCGVLFLIFRGVNG